MFWQWYYERECTEHDYWSFILLCPQEVAPLNVLEVNILEEASTMPCKQLYSTNWSTGQ